MLTCSPLPHSPGLCRVTLVPVSKTNKKIWAAQNAIMHYITLPMSYLHHLSLAMRKSLTFIIEKITSYLTIYHVLSMRLLAIFLIINITMNLTQSFRHPTKSLKHIRKLKHAKKFHYSWPKYGAWLCVVLTVIATTRCLRPEWHNWLKITTFPVDAWWIQKRHNNASGTGMSIDGESKIRKKSSPQICKHVRNDTFKITETKTLEWILITGHTWSNKNCLSILTKTLFSDFKKRLFQYVNI